MIFLESSFEAIIYNIVIFVAHGALFLADKQHRCHWGMDKLL